MRLTLERAFDIDLPICTCIPAKHAAAGQGRHRARRRSPQSFDLPICPASSETDAVVELRAPVWFKSSLHIDRRADLGRKIGDDVPVSGGPEMHAGIVQRRKGHPRACR